MNFRFHPRLPGSFLVFVALALCLALSGAARAAGKSDGQGAAFDPIFFVELGAVLLGLSALARLALKMGLTPIPFYLVIGLFLGQGGVLKLPLSEEFLHTASEIGVVLLLFMLGLEYSADELLGSLKRGARAGGLDFVLNFLPGAALAFVLGWGWLAALLLGGVTWISSSSIIAKVLADLDRLGNRETGPVLSVLVIEDLAMALYLPIIAVLLLGQDLQSGAVSVGIALATIGFVFLAAVKFGGWLSRVVSHTSSEVVLLSVFGLVLLVAGVAQRLQVSAAIGAFLVGIALSGGVARQAHDLLGPLRDLFAAMFFFFVGLQIDPSSLPGVLPVALGLAIVTAGTKIVTGFKAAEWEGVAPRGRMRAGTALVARGEFSVVIANLGANSVPGLPDALAAALTTTTAAYVLILAIGGPILTRYAEALSVRFQKPKPQPVEAAA
jgi:CPA2 family monovalent cation:H+ antiporter-2